MGTPCGFSARAPACCLRTPQPPPSSSHEQSKSPSSSVQASSPLALTASIPGMFPPPCKSSSSSADCKCRDGPTSALIYPALLLCAVEGCTLIHRRPDVRRLVGREPWDHTARGSTASIRLMRPRTLLRRWSASSVDPWTIDIGAAPRR